MSSFSGSWFSTFGPLVLVEDNGRVRGHYGYNGRECSLEGAIDNGRLIFTYHEPDHAGEGWFELKRDGKFVGAWRMDNNPRWGRWEGTRGFDGVWDSSYGRLRLIQEGERVFGFYEGAGSSTLEGKLEGNRITFRYQEPKTGGEGWFELADDGAAFQGEWRPDGYESWSTWIGKRIAPKPNLTWLVVLEAHWQRGLEDREYSFGGMLREYFARLEHVAVRQRFFDDAAGLKRWCRDLLYCPEPAIVMLASHGSADGLTVHGETIDCREVAKTLAWADSIRLLHFSACSTMAGGEEGAFVRALRASVSFPISGYTTSVDWGASALLEFTFLDLILSKGLDPDKAAEQLPKVVGYAGDAAPPGCPYRPAGFRFYPARAALESSLASRL
jgi:hypothetical protein